MYASKSMNTSIQTNLFCAYTIKSTKKIGIIALDKHATQYRNAQVFNKKHVGHFAFRHWWMTFKTTNTVKNLHFFIHLVWKLCNLWMWALLKQISTHLTCIRSLLICWSKWQQYEALYMTFSASLCGAYAISFDISSKPSIPTALAEIHMLNYI